MLLDNKSNRINFSFPGNAFLEVPFDLLQKLYLFILCKQQISHVDASFYYIFRIVIDADQYP